MNRKSITLKILVVLSLFSIATIVRSENERNYGIEPVTAFAKLQEQGDNILFLDVRDPIEITFIGSTDLVHANVPFLVTSRTEWNEETGTLRMSRYEGFIPGVEAALQQKGLQRDALIITMCRTGSARGEPSAAFLRENGFSNAHFIINGFEGEPLEGGPLEGHRLRNGWRNSGLPWSLQTSRDIIYLSSDQAEAKTRESESFFDE